MKTILMSCLGSVLIILLFLSLSCEVKKPETPSMPIPEKKVLPQPPPIVKPVPVVIPMVTKVIQEGNSWKLTVNKSALKPNLKVRLTIGYVTYEGVTMGNITKITPEWNPEGRVTVGIWNTKTKKYVSSYVVKKSIPKRVASLYILVAQDWKNNPNNWDNSSSNWQNSPSNWQNSPKNWDNNPSNSFRTNGIYDDKGNSVGYTTPKAGGGFNIYDTNGNRIGYKP